MPDPNDWLGNMFQGIEDRIKAMSKPASPITFTKDKTPITPPGGVEIVTPTTAPNTDALNSAISARETKRAAPVASPTEAWRKDSSGAWTVKQAPGGDFQTPTPGPTKTSFPTRTDYPSPTPRNTFVPNPTSPWTKDASGNWVTKSPPTPSPTPLPRPTAAPRSALPAFDDSAPMPSAPPAPVPETWGQSPDDRQDRQDRADVAEQTYREDASDNSRDDRESR